MVNEQARGVCDVTMFHGISGLFAIFASITQKARISTTEVIRHPTTNGSDHGRKLPPMDVATRNATTAVTTVIAPR